MTHELLRRNAAVGFVAEKYRGKVCDFRTADCVRMARTLLVKMGHKPPKLPRYSSLAGAKQALRSRGWANVTEMLDAVLPGRRIAPAWMRPGDLAVMLDEHGLGSVHVYLGGGKVLGWSEGGGEAVVIVAHRIEAAWGVA